MKVQDKIKNKDTQITLDRTGRLAFFDKLSNENLNKMSSFLTQMKRSGIGIYRIAEYEFRDLNNGDISLAYMQLNSLYPNNVVSLAGLVGRDTYAERTFIIDKDFDIALSEINMALQKRVKKSGTKKIIIKLNISDEISGIYKKIMVTNDIVTGGMKITGVGDCDILLGRKNEQTFILTQNVLHYHNITQDVEELYSILENSKRSSKKLLQPKNTNPLRSEKRNHIIQVVGEVNRTTKERNGVERLISVQAKGLSTDEIRLSFNLNLGRTSG
jgi:hypothetical protein